MTQKIELLDRSMAKITFTCQGKHETIFFTKEASSGGFISRNGPGIMSWFSCEGDKVILHTQIEPEGCLEQIVYITGIDKDERNRAI